MKPEINAICTLVLALIAVVIVAASFVSKLSSCAGRERRAAVAPVIASGAKQSSFIAAKLDCFVAALLAMTAGVPSSPIQFSNSRYSLIRHTPPPGLAFGEPGSSGVSSTPRLSLDRDGLWNTGSSAELSSGGRSADTLADDDRREAHLRDLAARCARSFAVRSALERTEGAGKTGCALHPRSRVQNSAKKRTRAYRFSGNTPAFPAQWFDGLWRALPGDQDLFVTVDPLIWLACAR